jgi:hypothetical protein
LLTAAGDQVPAIPLGEVFDKTGAVDPEQKGAIVAKFGVAVVGHGTVQVFVSVFGSQIPTHVKVNVDVCPGDIPGIVKLDGASKVPETGVPPSMV